MTPDSRFGPDSTPPLTIEEVRKLREVLRDAEHMTWLRKQVFLVVPIAFAVVSGLAAVVNWLVNNLSWKHP